MEGDQNELARMKTGCMLAVGVKVGWMVKDWTKGRVEDRVVDGVKGWLKGSGGE